MAAKHISYLLVLLLMAQASLAQRIPVDTGSQHGTVLFIRWADLTTMDVIDSLHNFTSISKIKGGQQAHVQQLKTHFYADSMVINNVDNSLEAFGSVHINDADSIHTYAQYVKYLGKEKKAFLKRKVRLTDGKGDLTTDELEYDVTVKIGTYLKGGKLVNKKTTLTSTEGYYYGETKDVIFKKKVVLIDPEYKVLTDTLQYNTNTEIANFTSPTVIYSDSGRRTIKTRLGYFDMKNKRGILNKRSVVEDSTATFTAEDMAVDDSTKMDEFRGNVVYRGKDTAKGYDLIANNVKTNRKKDIFLATQKPILIIKQGRDSVFVTADTFYSARLSDLRRFRKLPDVRDSIGRDTLTPPVDYSIRADSSNNKYFEAYYNVKIYMDSMQSVCDSMFYSLQDSVFRLFKHPVLWSRNSQITGDTIYLYIKNKNPERLYVFENAMAVSQVDSTQYFNQAKSNTMNARFHDGKISSVHLKGSAENVYYSQDEKNRFRSVDKATSSVINILFDNNNKPRRISYVQGYDDTQYPMRQANHEELKLRGFKWLDAVRPKSKFDILGN
jgi:archaellum component FlaG (FlaF/FlaG flagellin family)